MTVRDRVARASHVVVVWLTNPRPLRTWQRGYYQVVPVLLWIVIGLGLFLLASFFVVFLAATQHVRIEAKTDAVEIEFSPGQPIAWALGGARLLDCSQMALAGIRNNKKRLA